MGFHNNYLLSTINYQLTKNYLCKLFKGAFCANSVLFKLLFNCIVDLVHCGNLLFTL